MISSIGVGEYLVVPAVMSNGDLVRAYRPGAEADDDAPPGSGPAELFEDYPKVKRMNRPMYPSIRKNLWQPRRRSPTLKYQGT